MGANRSLWRASRARRSSGLLRPLSPIGFKNRASWHRRLSAEARRALYVMDSNQLCDHFVEGSHFSCSKLHRGRRLHCSLRSRACCFPPPAASNGELQAFGFRGRRLSWSLHLSILNGVCSSDLKSDLSWEWIACLYSLQRQALGAHSLSKKGRMQLPAR